MTSNERTYDHTDAELHVLGELTEDTYERIQRSSTDAVTFTSSPPVIKSIEIDPAELAFVLYEYDILKKTASAVETDVLRVFRESNEKVLTTAQVTDRTERTKSSVSRALGELTEEGFLNRIQNGVYQYQGL